VPIVLKFGSLKLHGIALSFRYTDHFEQQFFLKASVIFLLHLVKGSQSKNISIERFRKWVHMAATALEICDREKIY
jgi:hypothetical protein